MAAASRRSVGRRARRPGARLGEAARHAGAVIVAAVLLAGCSGGGEDAAERAYDLAAAFPIAEARRETGRIDFGTPAAREHLVAGWYANERGRGGETFVWSQGPASTLALFLAAARPLRAELLCAPAPGLAGRPQAVTIEVDGRRAGELVLSPGLRAYSVELPAELVRPGVNHLTFRYRHTVSPGRGGRRDGRRLAVAWHDLRLRPLPPRAAAPRVEAGARALVLPWGTEVAYVLDLEGEARLEVEEVAAMGGGRGRLVVGVQEEKDRVEKEVAAMRTAATGSTSLSMQPRSAAAVGLPGSGRRLVRMALRAVPEANAGPVAGGLRLRAPRVLAAASSPLPPPPPAGDITAVGAPGGHPAAAGPNILIYLIDALRVDRLGCYGSRRGLTPRIDAFAARALLFERAVAQATWTRPAVASIFTGLGPLQHGVRTLDDRLPAAAVTLAERLRAAGYRTAAFSTNAHVTRETGLAQGFEHFDFSPEAATSDAVNRRALAWLPAGPGEAPFFAYVHALDPHAPYTPPSDLRARFAPGVSPRTGTRAGVQRAYAARGAERARLVADLARLYDAEVAANDRSFGALLDALAARRLLERTVVVLLADHGEEFDEHGALGHANNLYAETLSIPLVVKLPRQARGWRVAALAQQIDVAPTLAALAGLAPPAGLPGLDLRRLAASDAQGAPPATTASGRRSVPASAPGDRPAFSHLSYSGRAGISVVLGEWKLIQPLSPGFGRGAELYRLAPGSHETARVNLIDRNPVRAAHLTAFLRAERLAAQRGFASERAELDLETRRALEALGYL